MKPHEISKAFDALRMSTPGTTPFRALDVPGDAGVMLAVDEGEGLHLLARTAQGDPFAGDQASAGIHLRHVQLVEDGAVGAYADLALLKPHLQALFCSVAGDAIREISSTPRTAPDQSMRVVLARWRELIDAATATMGPTRQTGLFGELWVLREIVRTSGPNVDCWIGPENGHHDFSSPTGVDLEVKTSRSDGPRVVQISSLDQLSLGGAKVLYLAALAVRRVNATGDSIGALVNELVSMGCSRSALVLRLQHLGVGEDLLATLDVQFEVSDAQMYPVDASFPKLTREMLLGEVDDRVRRVGYQLDLTGLGNALPPIDHSLVYLDLGAPA